MAEKVFVNDYVSLNLQTGKNISPYDIFKIKYKKPNGSSGFWTAALSGTSNYIVTAVVNFDIPGIWKVQAYVADSSLPQKYHGMWAEIKVYEAIANTTTAAPTTSVATTAPPTTAST